MRVICTTFITPHSHHTGRQNLRSRCGIECCEATAVKCTHLASKDEAEHTLNQMVTALTVENAKHSHISLPDPLQHHFLFAFVLTKALICPSVP